MGPKFEHIIAAVAIADFISAATGCRPVTAALAAVVFVLVIVGKSRNS